VAGAAGTDAAGRPVRYGGFYTKAEVGAIVAYAAARHVTIVPEIDVPGHATAAIAAYPELASSGTPAKVPSSDWGVIDNLFNTEDSTFTFLENVLDEVLELFPSPYIHMGGDEAVKTQWIADPRAQARIKALGLTNEAELQGWFVARLGDYLATKGRKLVGWDEILDGNVPASATVMSWHGGEVAASAARAGHDVILAPSPDFYLDHIQSMSPDEPPGRGDAIDWRHFYATTLVPADLGEADKAHVVGVQANLWTEHVRTTGFADRMLWPRAALLAEIGWTPPAQRDWDSVAQRLPAELARETALGGAYDATPLEPLASFAATGAAITVNLTAPAAVGVIRYTTDASQPGPSSAAYSTPLSLPSGTELRARSFAGKQPLGAEKRWTIDPGLLRTRSASELELCTRRVPLRLEDDAPTSGARPVFWGDIMHPCWIWRAAPLDGPTRLAARVGQVPFNFSLGADRAKVIFDPPQSPAGELLVRLDGPDAPIAARIPLGSAATAAGVSTITGTLAGQGGNHDLYLSFAQSGPEPLWMLESLTLEPAR
jgi:hexosaminidase